MYFEQETTTLIRRRWYFLEVDLKIEMPFNRLNY